MTDILFEHDHILIRSEYRTPDIHRHLASHIAFGIASNYIGENIMEKLCDVACLSKSRLSHLFKEQMGIALGRYLVLAKMKKGYLHYCSTGNITEAALNAGFDSPSHFAATCKRMFGISFSEFIKS